MGFNREVNPILYPFWRVVNDSLTLIAHYATPEPTSPSSVMIFGIKSVIYQQHLPCPFSRFLSPTIDGFGVGTLSL